MPLPWEEALEADRRHRNWSDDSLISLHSIERGLRRISKERGEWAGIPMPLSGEDLVIDPSYKFAEALMSIKAARPEDPDRNSVGREFRCVIDEEDQPRERNRFWSWKWRMDVVIYESKGKIRWTLSNDTNNRSGLEMTTLGCSDAWSLETELRALETLRGLIAHRQFRQYFLTGSFLETSKRSGIKYMFRKLRPTLAISEWKERQKIIAALCLHPIGYYSGSWAGAMTPTDDVLAHLMMMRGDEKLFWRRANQHPAHSQSAGI